jgi:hypothetical protein
MFLSENCISSHMVAVTLENKETDVGLVRACGVTVEQGERDLVLEDPAVYREDSKSYIALPYQHMFLRASLVYCIAVIHDPSIDQRTIPVGASPFSVSKSASAATGPGFPA